MKKDVSDKTMKMYLSTLNGLAKAVGHNINDSDDDDNDDTYCLYHRLSLSFYEPG